MPTPRSIAIYAISLIAAFGISSGIGYIYEYSPERDVVELLIDHSADVPRESEIISGTVREVSDSAITVEIRSDTLELALTAVALEELLPLEDLATIAAGTRVNLGGERTSTERVITGLVFFDGQVLP